MFEEIKGIKKELPAKRETKEIEKTVMGEWIPSHKYKLSKEEKNFIIPSTPGGSERVVEVFSKSVKIDEMGNRIEIVSIEDGECLVVNNKVVVTLSQKATGREFSEPTDKFSFVDAIVLPKKPSEVRNEDVYYIKCGSRGERNRFYSVEWGGGEEHIDKDKVIYKKHLSGVDSFFHSPDSRYIMVSANAYRENRSSPWAIPDSKKDYFLIIIDSRTREVVDQKFLTDEPDAVLFSPENYIFVKQKDRILLMAKPGGDIDQVFEEVTANKLRVGATGKKALEKK